MECEGFEAVVVDLLYGELPAERKPEVDAHAADCPKCGTLARELAEARQLASSLPARVAPPRELDERIAIAARAAADRDVSRMPLRGSALHVAAAALLVALLSSTGFLLGRLTAKPEKVITKYVPSEPWSPPPDSSVPVPHDPHDRPRPSTKDQRDPGAKYMEELLSLGQHKLEKGEFREALTIFGGIYATGGRLPAAVDARLGMAEAYLGLGRPKDLDEAERIARTIRDDVDQLDPTVEQGARAQAILERVKAARPIDTNTTPH